MLHEFNGQRAIWSFSLLCQNWFMVLCQLIQIEDYTEKKTILLEARLDSNNYFQSQSCKGIFSAECSQCHPHFGESKKVEAKAKFNGRVHP